MNYREASARLAEYRGQIAALREKMRQARAAAEPEIVADYAFATPKGEVRLSELFGDKAELILIHNMGSSCPSCTMWADGFNGVYHHLADRAAFVVTSPEPPAVQQSFAAGRGWGFAMVSHAGSGFAADMGYRAADGGWLPGVSVFRRDQDRIVRIADSHFAPTDDFCVVWHMFDLLPQGAGGWTPKYRYG